MAKRDELAPRWIEELGYEIALWTEAGQLEEVLARAGNLQVAVAAYMSALLAFPGRHVTLRQGTQIIRERKPKARDLPSRDVMQKRVVEIGKPRGYVTIEELNQLLPSDNVAPDEIEDFVAKFIAMGINVIETDEAEEADGEDDAGT